MDDLCEDVCPIKYDFILYEVHLAASRAYVCRHVCGPFGRVTRPAEILPAGDFPYLKQLNNVLNSIHTCIQTSIRFINILGC